MGITLVLVLWPPVRLQGGHVVVLTSFPVVGRYRRSHHELALEGALTFLIVLEPDFAMLVLVNTSRVGRAVFAASTFSLNNLSL